MKKEIIISLPSKGRLRFETLRIFKKKKLNIKFDKGDRDLIGRINHKKFDIVCIFQHARECIVSIANNNSDIAISGIDLLLNSDLEILSFKSWSISLEKSNTVSKEYPLSIT